jgi:hypothetical protein
MIQLNLVQSMDENDFCFCLLKRCRQNLADQTDLYSAGFARKHIGLDG